MHISSADKKEKPWFLKALKTRRNPFFDKTVRKTGFIQIQNGHLRNHIAQAVFSHHISYYITGDMPGLYCECLVKVLLHLPFW